MRNLLGRVIDEEWVVLIKEAKDLGLSMEEVREFLQKKANQLGHEDCKLYPIEWTQKKRDTL